MGRNVRQATSPSPNQVLTHAARAAAKQAPLEAARGAREGLWLEQTSPNQVLTHAARAAAKQLNKVPEAPEVPFTPEVHQRCLLPFTRGTRGAFSGTSGGRARRALVRVSSHLWQLQSGGRARRARRAER